MKIQKKDKMNIQFINNNLIGIFNAIIMCIKKWKKHNFKTFK
jgi:hypothetical protein